MRASDSALKTLRYRRSSSSKTRCNRQNHAVVPRCAWSRIQVLSRREHDLIDRQAVLACLHANRLGSCRLEVNEGSKNTDAPAVVLPAPSRNAAARAIFEVHFQSARRAAAIDSRTRRVGTSGELNKDGVVGP